MLIFNLIGVVSVIVFVLFIILLFIYKIFKTEVPPHIPEENMPLLRPLPIKTKNRPFLMRILVWFYEVRQWELIENWHFKLENGTEIVLHEGFKFDGASIPRPFWFILNPVGLLMIPALIHDYGYMYQQLWEKDKNGVIVEYKKGENRSYWDNLFKVIGKHVNGFAIIDFIAWIGVRIGGICSWRDHRKNEVPPIKPVLY